MRGDIHRLPARKDSGGHEPRDARYGVVVQSDDLRLSTVLVAPTSRSAGAASFRPLIEIDGNETAILPEQTRAIDAQHLGSFVGRLDSFELAELEQAYRNILDIQ